MFHRVSYCFVLLLLFMFWNRVESIEIKYIYLFIFWFHKRLIFLKFYSLDFHFVAYQLIHIRDHDRTLNIHQHKRGNNEWIESIVGTSCRSGIYVEFILMFVRLEFMSVSRYQNVHIQLSLNQSQCFRITPRYHLMAMWKSNSKLSDCHHLLLWVTQILQFNRKSLISKRMNHSVCTSLTSSKSPRTMCTSLANVFK